MSPTQLTLAHCRKIGGLVAVVEKWNQYARIRQDMFGMFDVLHVVGDTVYGIQTTSASNMSARINKLQASPNLSIWCSLNRKALVHGWHKSGPRGGRKVWTIKEVEVLPLQIAPEST